MATLTRREALQIAGLGAVAVAASPVIALAQTPAFPKGAVIRTLFRDYAPAELGGGATLFHEHLSLGHDFGDRFRAAAAAVLAARGESPPANPPSPPPAPPGPDPMRDVDLMAEELRAAQRDGVACIVDAGLGRDDQVVPLVMALIEAGFADHVLISGDASRSYGRPLTAFVPKLKAAGASDEVLRQITVDNPRRFLAFVPKRARQL